MLRIDFALFPGRTIDGGVVDCSRLLESDSTDALPHMRGIEPNDGRTDRLVAILFAIFDSTVSMMRRHSES